MYDINYMASIRWNIFEIINCEIKFADTKIIAYSSPTKNESDRKSITKTKKQ